MALTLRLTAPPELTGLGVPLAGLSRVINWARSVREIAIALYVSVAFGQEELELTRPQMAWSVLNSPPDSVFAGLGRGDLQAATDALRAGDLEPARKLMTDDVLRRVLLWGAPAEIGRRLASLVREHRPSSVGLCLLQEDLPRTIDSCAAAFRAMRRELD